MTTRPSLAALFGAVAFVAGCAGDPHTSQAVGTLERDRLELIAEASEPIVQIRLREGAPVAAGDLILQLDQTRLGAEVRRAEAARDLAAARFTELQHGPRLEQIDAARARLVGAEAALERARLDLARLRTLRSEGVESQAQLDSARAAHDQALALSDQARAALQELLAGTRPEQIDQGRAALAEAESALAALRVSFDRLTVRAPRDGQLDSLPYKPGERPPPGAVVAVVLADGAPYARVYVPETIRAGVRPGTAATVWLDGVDASFAGRVRIVANDPTFTPFYALTERDRGRLVYVAEVDLTGDAANELPTGIPVQVRFERSADTAPESGHDVERGHDE